MLVEDLCARGPSGSGDHVHAYVMGRAMLMAIAADVLALEHEPVLLLAEGVEGPKHYAVVQRIARDEEPVRAAAELLQDCDVGLVIAPESDNLLNTWLNRLRAAAPDKRLINTSVAAARLCGDKLALAEHLRSHRIPTPTTKVGVDPDTLPAVVKPRYGAGCGSTAVVRWPDARPRFKDAEQWVHQPVVPGEAVSVSFIASESGRIALPPGRQRLTMTDRIEYLGGALPINAPDRRDRATDLATRALATLDGLNGWVGVDLVLGDSAADDQIIEINPRLTMSYLGLRQLSETNLAECLLDNRAPSGWRPGSVLFDRSGQITWDSP